MTPTTPQPGPDSINDLIARSSLGTPTARRARARVSPDRARRLLLAADAKAHPQNVGGDPGHEHYIVGVDNVPPQGTEATDYSPPAPRRQQGGEVRKSYPATSAGLRQMGRDMQKELEKSIKPVTVPIRYRYTTSATGVTASPWAASGDTVNNHYGDNHYGDVVSIHGDHNAVAVGNTGPVTQNTEASDNQWRIALLAALGNVQSHLDELDLDDDDRDTIEDATTSAAAIAASPGDDVDEALRRRGNRVLGVLEKVMTAASGGVIAHTLAPPLQQLLA